MYSETSVWFFFIYIYAAVLLYLCRAARVFVFENAWARMYFTCMSARIWTSVCV